MPYKEVFTFADKVENAYRAYGTLKETAAHYGVAVSTIQRWRNGGNASKEHAQKINRSFGQLKNYLMDVVQVRRSEDGKSKQIKTVFSEQANTDTQRQSIIDMINKANETGDGFRLLMSGEPTPEYPDGDYSSNWFEGFDDIDEILNEFPIENIKGIVTREEL